MSSAEERKQIREVLVPEILADFDRWGAEYQQERDLGTKGEFANLYRKTRKLKTVLWDGGDASTWREGIRTIVKEVIAHGLLLLVDLDKEMNRPERVSGLSTHPPFNPAPDALPRRKCGPDCSPRIHMFKESCRYRLASDLLSEPMGEEE